MKFLVLFLCPFGIKMGTLYYATRYVMYVHGCIHTWSYIITDILYFTISYFIYGRRQQNSSLIQCLRKRDKRSFLRTHSKSNMKSGVKDNKNRLRWKLHHVVNKKTHEKFKKFFERGNGPERNLCQSAVFKNKYRKCKRLSK